MSADEIASRNSAGDGSRALGAPRPDRAGGVGRAAHSRRARRLGDDPTALSRGSKQSFCGPSAVHTRRRLVSPRDDDSHVGDRRSVHASRRPEKGKRCDARAIHSSVREHLQSARGQPLTATGPANQTPLQSTALDKCTRYHGHHVNSSPPVRLVVFTAGGSRNHACAWTTSPGENGMPSELGLAKR